MSKIGRNEPCPCGSGKKFKRCCINKEVLKENLVPYFPNRITDEEMNDMSNEEIIEMLNNLGIPFEEETFLKEVEIYHSAEEISERWFKKYNISPIGYDEDFPWFAATKLWERLAPNHILSLEQLDDLIERGYDHLEEGDYVLACDAWLEFWEALKYRIKPPFKDLSYLDDKYRGAFFIGNICQELEMELDNAGTINPIYFEKRIHFCKEFCEYFPKEDESMIHNMRRAIGQSYEELKQHEKADEYFQQLVLEYPNNPWGYISWGDLFDRGARKDHEKAKELYEKALVIAKDDSDKEIVLDRLKGLETTV